MTITIELRNEKTAMALAQACKRFSTTTADRLAADERETHRIMDGIQALGEALANARLYIRPARQASKTA